MCSFRNASCAATAAASKWSDGLSAGRRRSYCSYQQRRSVSAHPGASGSARPGDDALAERKDGDGGPLAAQRWLLVLRLVRQGVYATLARDYEDDVRQLRQILALGSAESRRELTVRTLLALPDEERAHFAATVGRIAGNLAVGRDARDAELHAKVSEVQAHVDAYQTMYAAGEGSPL